MQGASPEQVGMTATARRVGNTLKHEVDVNGRHVIVTDEPEALGGSDEGPAPHELLAAMLASCIATTIAMYAEKRNWDIGEIAVDVNYEPDSTPRHVAVRVHLLQGLAPDQRRRLERVAETCLVRRALEAGFAFEERIVTNHRSRAMASLSDPAATFTAAAIPSMRLAALHPARA